MCYQAHSFHFFPFLPVCLSHLFPVQFLMQNSLALSLASALLLLKSQALSSGESVQVPVACLLNAILPSVVCKLPNGRVKSYELTSAWVALVCQYLGYPQESQVFCQPWKDKNFSSANILSPWRPSRATFWDLGGKSEMILALMDLIFYQGLNFGLPLSMIRWTVAI